VPEAETVVVPVGGGGLAAGIALALSSARPGTRVIGVRSAPDGFALADGIAVKRPGKLTEPLLDELLDEVVEVSADDIAQAIVLLLERTKLVVEGAGAVGIAALLEGKIAARGSVVAVLSGGNIDASTLIAVARHGVTAAGRHLVVRTAVPDRPGELLKLLQLVAEERVNVLAVEHRREGVDIPLGATGIDLTLLTRDEGHCGALLAQMRGWGYEVERLR
jgi:threonine dehydratase